MSEEDVKVNQRISSDLVQFVPTVGGKMMLWVYGTTVNGKPKGVKTLLLREEWELVKQAGDRAFIEEASHDGTR